MTSTSPLSQSRAPLYYGIFSHIFINLHSTDCRKWLPLQLGYIVPLWPQNILYIVFTMHGHRLLLFVELCVSAVIYYKGL